jgi:hypothetical protein
LLVIGYWLLVGAPDPLRFAFGVGRVAKGMPVNRHYSMSVILNEVKDQPALHRVCLL